MSPGPVGLVIHLIQHVQLIHTVINHWCSLSHVENHFSEIIHEEDFWKNLRLKTFFLSFAWKKTIGNRCHCEYYT